MYTKKLELEIYRKALIDWKRPIEEAQEQTEYGFCVYFRINYGIDFIDFQHVFKTLWRQGIINTGRPWKYHYSTSGDLPKGRKQRVSALKAAIKELENALKN